IRALAARPIEIQLLALRLLNALMIVGATLCAYAAARELCDDRPPTADHRRPVLVDGGGHGGAALQVLGVCNADLNSQFSMFLPLAAGLLVALHPMFVFAGVGAGNDGLANLIGAALCWAVLRAARLGLSLRRAATLLALALLGLLTKRTLL